MTEPTQGEIIIGLLRDIRLAVRIIAFVMVAIFGIVLASLLIP